MKSVRDLESKEDRYTIVINTEEQAGTPILSDREQQQPHRTCMDPMVPCIIVPQHARLASALTKNPHLAPY